MTEKKSSLDGNRSGSSILIIDDSVDTIRLLSTILRDLGQISFATNGETGLEIAIQRPPDLILLDVEMPNMDGYEVCRRLKANLATHHCAIIFVTAHSTPEEEVAALDAGAVDFIAKPLNPPVVRARVQTHLRLQLNSTALAKLASKDALTGLYNRRYFDSIAEKELLRHRRQKLPLGVVFVDIDCFKAYNDGYGHQQGDICLRQVANAIDFATRRPDEIVARFGGEEFIVILPYSSPDDVIAYGEWICKRVRDMEIEHAFSSVSPFVTISVGATSGVPREGDDMEKFVRAADEALYVAKSSGRNCAKIVLPDQASS
jgi:diguanylate cyclase (GGDEF)-like protein